MQIDWVTVAAQVVNFAVLVWLLQRVLYRPVSRALAARAEAVAARLSEAETARAEAEAEAARLRSMQHDLDRQKAAALDEARRHADRLKHELVEEAQAGIAAERDEWRRQLAAEKTAFLAELRRRGAQSFATALARALSEMADAELAERMAAVLARRLTALDPDTAARLQTAAARGAAPRVRSSAELGPAARERLSEALAGVAAAPAAFSVEPELGTGLAVEIGPIHLRWTIGDYLDDLEADLAEAIEDQAGRAEPAEAG